MERFQIVSAYNKDLPISFNMRALYNFQRATGQKLTDAEEFMQDLGMIGELMYYGFEEGHKLAKKPFELNKEDILAMPFSEFQPIQALIIQAFNAEPVKKKQGASKAVAKANQ